MRLIFLITTVFLFLLTGVSAMGIGEWQHVTKNGIVLHNSLGPTFIEWKSERIENVGKWYYYKDNIVGITNLKSWQTDTTQYFILHEKSKGLFITSDIKEWQSKLKSEKLNPIFTRWHNSHVGAVILVFFAAVYWFISIPIALFILWIIIRLFISSIKVRFDIKDMNVQYLLFFVLVFLLCFWGSINYNSF